MIVSQSKLFSEESHTDLQTIVNAWILDNFTTTKFTVMEIQYAQSHNAQLESTVPIYSALVHYTIEESKISLVTDSGPKVTAFASGAGADASTQ